MKSDFKKIFLGAVLAAACGVAFMDSIPSVYAQDTIDPRASETAAIQRLKDQQQTVSIPDSVKGSTKKLFSSGGYSTDAQGANLPGRIASIVNGVFGASGTLFLGMVIYSGIMWMTAGGNEETVKKSRKRITRATVGLAILLSSWIITNFVLRGIFFGNTPRSIYQPGGNYTSPGGGINIQRTN